MLKIELSSLIRRLALTVSDIKTQLFSEYIQRIRGIAQYSLYKITTNIFTDLMTQVLHA